MENPEFAEGLEKVSGGKKMKPQMMFMKEVLKNVIWYMTGDMLFMTLKWRQN